MRRRAGPPWPRRSRRPRRARAPSPGPARSGHRAAASASAARSTADRPRVPEPQTSPISSAAVSPPTPRRAAAREALGDRALSRIARPRPARASGWPSGDARCGLPATAAPPSERVRRSGRPRARTTGARRFPPPSGPRGRRRAYRATLTGGSTAGSPRGSSAAAAAVRPVRRGATSARMSRIAVERRVQPERGPDRAAPDEEPAERERDRDPRQRKPRTPGRTRRRPSRPTIVRTGRRRRPARPSTRPRRDPDPAHPGRRGEAAEQDLLAERRHERAGHERQGEARPASRSVAAG